MENKPENIQTTDLATLSKALGDHIAQLEAASKAEGFTALLGSAISNLRGATRAVSGELANRAAAATAAVAETPAQ